MPEGSPKQSNMFFPKKPPKPTSHIVRPVNYIGNISAVLALLSLFSGLLGFIGSFSRLFNLGINMPGVVPVSILGLLFSLIAIALAGKQDKIERTSASKVAATLAVIGLVSSVLAISAILTAPSASFDNSGFNFGSDSGSGGNGYCSSTSECSNFGSKHCDGGAVCSSDSLCHCAFVFCTGNGCNPMSCSQGCDPNSYCDAQSGICVFNNGGKIND